MRFTKLKLTGFKSFVDPTDLIIADGLTGVVGPNGCGKSNLLEALRWVMGENRPTAMRGGGMEDVIFAGAATRPARNFAEVSLHIDNSDRLAPAGFNDHDHIDIVRRITRDVGSAYKAGGKDVRARDVQMLFADASTGAHSPALVRQGQISELINAKPKSRRRILEEAAGISGLYQRRHEAELKLKGAEANLTRVDDVVEQLAAQLAQLARQARQAARYREIGTELRRTEGMLLYRRWREADDARATADEALRARVTAAAQAEARVQTAIKARAAAEDGLPALREEEAIAAALVQRLIVQRDTLTDQEAQALRTIETLVGRIDQLGRDIEREGGLNRDAGETIERLEWEQTELRKASEGHEDRLEAAVDAAHEAASVLQDREADLGTQTEDVARLLARHGSAQRLLDDSRKTEDRSESEAAKARDAVAASQTALTKAGHDFEAAEQASRVAEETAQRADAALTAAEIARADAQTREADARAERSEAEGEMNALRAEVGALAKLVERDTAEGGQILDRLQVQKGFEKALGAALADDLRAPQVDGDGPSGWAVLPAYDSDQPLPAGVTPITQHVSVPEVLTRRMSQIGLCDSEDAARLQEQLKPGQRLVSPEGDLWRWDGFRAWAEDAPSAAALRLQQLNRLEELKQGLEHASQRAEGARSAHEALTARLSELSNADKAAREARREADRLVADAGRALSRAEADRNLAEGRLESLSMAVKRHEEEAMAARSRVLEAQRALDELDDVDEARAAVEDLRMTVEAARITMMSRRSAQDELRREGEARTRRSQEVTKELSGWRHRLETAEKRSAELVERKAQSEAELKAAQAVPTELAAKRADLSEMMAEAEDRKAAATDALSVAEGVLREATVAEREAERAASEAREARAASEARAEAARETVQAAAERIAEEQQQTPNQLLTALDVDPGQMPRSDALEADVNRLKRQREALGAVNLRAEEDAREVQEEHDTLVSEKADLEEAIKTLRSGIASLNREGRERLLTAFEQVNSNFSLLFTHLFGGGEANLVMVESDDPLEAGLEIMCQPPGKKLSTLSLLSGGEQTLTAMALIFAVFLANPAPICVLDEVDAPLDDANVTRFCDLLDEMCRQTDTRFLIITHHAVTMARMDRLFGVTMGEQGVSQLVSVDLKKAAKLVA
ncbi:chromosome segregation protein SMC [Pseudosulfitobacter pseudonitzschiae]|uniref:chromosome segregation protein SMC n=1 Tax=Pseudosulfitobacter pseudonitzschiae TaxID=1402135 RepID=UPI001AF67967|nr:chromosome segregation protein SMC [Pseudosulfitobacter pseudonitzschiae]MBM1816580.1 chromosome segregation protein SMC [Pseudosulfitobacter pseudonitzschiae]MBM1833178.1 chromosome segregation protein SMC [Pseudosulfitobacter pseudonitzschiae]MBM1838046.1 chromosome segregation protein SMC [Pseudosulfitobacter pseudonitzschiae]MBM1843307.1 chromosome segregation protein SMC [Pseudosulfitobacter pseudonitzschiae]MBM1848173.1 chromosome segregation protein SMC [Pseudosulfitobacter pseudonit